MVVVTVIYIFLLAFWTWLHGFKPARFYMISWTIFLLIAAASVLEKMSLFSSRLAITDLLIQFGAVYVVAFQSLALADRFNLYRQEMLNTQTALVTNQQEALKLKDELTRSLEFSRSELEQRISERTQTLHELNQELATEIENRKLAQKEAEMLARTDPLTGLYNRRYFSHLVEYEVSKALRYNHSLSILILDIDYFKLVNDTFGHQVGDQALIHLARLFQCQSREVDILARYGGEEFVALLPETTLIEARAAAERLRIIIKDTPLELEGIRVCMTVSIGVAAMTTDGQFRNFDDLLKHADEALYQAKHAGRNRVVTFPASF
jgi:diguanylate cyclase